MAKDYYQILGAQAGADAFKAGMSALAAGAAAYGGEPTSNGTGNADNAQASTDVAGADKTHNETPKGVVKTSTTPSGDVNAQQTAEERYRLYGYNQYEDEDNPYKKL